MCEYWDSPDVTMSGVSVQDMRIIVEEHNRYRRSALPRAANMQMMYWDANIAVLAQKWANTCPTHHDTNANRRVPGYGMYIGQNIARGPVWHEATWVAAIYAWYIEVEDFTFGESAPEGIMVGHYTQVMRSSASRIGCGFAQCPIGNIYVCNYLSGNNMLHPYEISENNRSSSRCPLSAAGGLCDCGSKACYNGGILDINERHCSCRCQGIFSGPSCDEMDCRIPDPWFCGGTGEGCIPREGCLQYHNVPSTCPHMCGTCPTWVAIQQQFCSKVCLNGGSMDINACLCTCPSGFTGETCNLNVCDLGNTDPSYCGGIPVYTYQPEDCHYTNVKRDCAYMCNCRT